MAIPLKLKVYKADALVAEKDFQQPFIKIGRLSSAHLCLDDEKVSRIHAVLDVSPDGALSVIDMGSMAGTFINGKRVNKGTVKLGDEILLGNTRIVVEAAPAAVSVAAAAPAELPLFGTEPTFVGKVPAPLPAAAPAAVVAGAVAAAPAPVLQASPVAAQRAMAPAAQPAVVLQPVAPDVTAAARPRGPIDGSFAPTQQARAASPGGARPRRDRSGPQSLQIRYLWGDHVLAVASYASPRKVIVGSRKGSDFEVSAERLGARERTLIRSDKGEYVLCFAGKDPGEIERDGKVLPLAQLAKSGAAESGGDGYRLALRPNDVAWVRLGDLRAEVCFVATPKQVAVPLGEKIDFSFLNLVLLLAFVVGGFIISATNFPYETDVMGDDLFKNQARFTKLIIKPAEREREKKNPLLENLKKMKDVQAGEVAAKHSGEEGKMGKKDVSPNKNNRSAPKAIDINAKELVKNLGIISAVKGAAAGGGLSTIFGSGGLGGDIKGAIGNMFGNRVGDAGGFGGLGMKGTGTGGGGQSNTIGIGGIGTLGRGGGLGGYGKGVGSLGGKSSVDPTISSSEAVVMGSLDKELIRQVINRNKSQIRYCYESQLNRYPNLNGKVMVKFVISASGTVASAQVVESTAKNQDLERCVASRVHSWEFPKPKGGGIVVVTYPFIFKQSGE